MLKNKLILSFILTLFALQVQGQKEKGGFKKNPVIKVNTGQFKDNKDKDQDYDIFLPNLQANTSFEVIEKKGEAVFKATKDENSTVSTMDTSSFDEGEPLVIEVEEQIQFVDDNTLSDASDEWTSIATYYSIWDTQNIDPYGINPKEFDDVIDIELYNREQGRMFAMPLNENKQTSPFGPRWGRLHAGVDLDLNTGDPVYTTFDGIVRVVGWDGGGYGNFVIVRHYNGLETLYGHLSRATVVPNTYVKAQDMIGLGGNTGRSTGSHLHFETRYEGNPFAPTQIFEFGSQNMVGEHFLLTARVFDYYISNMENEYGSAARKVRHRRVVYTRVKSGDTLTEIAARAGMSVEKLARLNGIRASGNLRAGKRLRVR
jgi:murein DD-endopeptidase MepM/ murein hydrolase activator NlpD